MPMRLKLNDDGFAFVSDDGHPVYLMDDDGSEEQAVDVPALYTKVPELTKEATKYRKQRNDVRDQLNLFEGIEDIKDWKTKAEQAIETVQNLKDKELVDAGKVEQIKSAMKDAHAQELKDVKQSYENKIAEQTDGLQKKDGIIYDLMVKQNFHKSPFFTGNEANPPKTILLPDIAYKYFKDHFKVEEGDNGELVTIGYDARGNQLYSPKRPGELADFDEAMNQILNNYAGKNDIMRPAKGGSGAGGGQGHGQTPQGELAKLEGAYKEAQDKGDAKSAIAIKNRMHRLQQAQKSGATA